MLPRRFARMFVDSPIAVGMKLENANRLQVRVSIRVSIHLPMVSLSRAGFRGGFVQVPVSTVTQGR